MYQLPGDPSDCESESTSEVFEFNLPHFTDEETETQGREMWLKGTKLVIDRD